MSRTMTASVRVAMFVAVAAASVAPASAAKRTSTALVTRDSLRQTLAFRASGPAAGVTVRETRRLRASVNVPLPDIDPAAVTGNTYVGVRIGDWTFQRPVSFDRTWRPGKTRASFRVASSDPRRPGVTTVRANWAGGALAISVVSTSEAPIAAAKAAAPAGPVSSAIDGAARLGGQHVHLGGEAAGAMTRTIVPVLDSSVDLARVELVGRADVLPDSADSTPPVVTITSPDAVSTAEAGPLHVEGAVRDDRSVASLSWSIDGGAATSASFDPDPASGFLDELRGTFSFSAPATGGVHSLRVVARDAAGNTGTATIAYTVPVADGIVLRMSKWGATSIDEQSRVQSWGYNTLSPTVAPGVPAAQDATGNLALLADGTVTTLRGDPSGAASPSVPYQVAGLSDVAAIAQCSTNSASFALRADGTVWAWGDDSGGQMGDGGGSSRYPPVQVPGLPPIKAVSAGAYHAIALDRQGGVWTWGGASAPTGPAGRSPHQVAGVANAVVISASQFDRYATSAAVLADGTLWMWGDGLSGQLGGAVAAREAPAFQVTGVAGARSVAMGYNHALVLLADGTVIARGSPTSQVWGYWGELGDGTSTPHIEFQVVPGLAGVTQIAAGAHTSSALLGDGTIRAWGQNTYGSLGDGTTTDAPSPVTVLLAQ